MTFLWQTSGHISKKFYKNNMHIENFFKEIYQPFDVVYVSRARVAISLIQQAEQCSRNELTFVQPYSSCCVLSAVSEYTTPSTICPELTDYQIIYHQFGHKNLVDKNLYKNILIEDSVDSLIITNNKNEIFPNNGRYCIISLSKILRLPYGAIVICEGGGIDADKLRKLRDENNIELPENYDNLIENNLYFTSILRNNPQISPVNEYSTIKKLFNESKNKITENITKLSNKFPELNIKPESYTNRLPANLYFNTASDDILIEINKMINIEIPARNYYDYNNKKCFKVNLIPVHIDANYI